ncbi:MAG: hypothetical protein ABSG87_10390 [Verrucomicrobiota bacterium]|jgi:predicted DNA-binding transcriptional regulator AlpA
MKQKTKKEKPGAAIATQPTATIPQPMFATKRETAAAIQLSIRTLDTYIARGLPHLRLGARRCRFDLQEVKSWLNENYKVQRR